MADDKKTKPKENAKEKPAIEPKADAKAEAPTEAKADAPKNYSRGEGQKAVTQAYKDNWNAIYGKKEEALTRPDKAIAARPGFAASDAHKLSGFLDALKLDVLNLCRFAEIAGLQRRPILIPWILLDTASVPGDGGQLSLMRRGAELSIRLRGNELMNSRLGGSEEALATLACAKVPARKNPRVLIGGLGMGFTLRATLAALGPTAQVTVAELVPAVVTWARGPMAEVFGKSLDDPRVCVREVDVGQLIRCGPSAFDVILLDVDNGPEGLTRAANGALYDLQGLRAARTALSSGGLLAVWSAGPNSAFAKRLLKTGFCVSEVRARASKSRTGAKHVIWIATAPVS